MATVERTLIPIGVASMSFICDIPSHLTSFICSGSLVLLIEAVSAGIKLSNTKVVLPDPETPVTTVNLPFGIFTSIAFTV